MLLVTIGCILILIRQLSTIAMMWKVNGLVLIPHLLVLFLLLFFASCSKDPLLPYTCENNDCSAYFEVNAALDSNGYYRVKLNYGGEYYPWFSIDVFATRTNQYWWYNDIPVVEAEFTGDKYIELPYETVPVVQETQIYLSGKQELLYGKRIIGPIPPSMKGDTLVVNAEIYWDAGNNSKFQNYSFKFILE